jgi:hypothetical protein
LFWCLFGSATIEPHLAALWSLQSLDLHHNGMGDAEAAALGAYLTARLLLQSLVMR